MKKIVLLLGIFLIGAMLFACAPRVIPVEKPTSSEVQPRDTGKADWELEWERTLTEAKKEGKVVVYGAPKPELRAEYIKAFQKTFPGITLEYTGLTGAQLAPKLLAERRAGLYLADVHIGGTTSMLTTLKEILVPIEHFLILDAVKDPKNWGGSKLEFADDEGKLVLVFAAKVSGSVVYNTQMVNKEKMDLFSLRELLEPQWRRKVLFSDPRIAGRGLEFAGWAYPHKELGEDFFKGLARNEVVLGRDIRQMLEWVGRSKYPLLLAAPQDDAYHMIKDGIPLGMVRKFKEGNQLSSAHANVAVLDRGPHPNATKIFINWLLSRDAQTIWAEVIQMPSLRNDVPTDFLIPLIIPEPDIQYDKAWTEKSVREKMEIQQDMIRIFGTP